jgi:ankyrin repeat protein
VCVATIVATTSCRRFARKSQQSDSGARPLYPGGDAGSRWPRTRDRKEFTSQRRPNQCSATTHSLHHDRDAWSLTIVLCILWFVAMAVDTEFFEAVKRNDVAAVRALLQGQSDLTTSVTDHGKTALHWAAEKDAVDVAAVLIDSGSDIEATTSWGASPLDWAAALGAAEVADLLLARGATGFTLVVAASLGRLNEVQSIVESGQDLARHRRRDAPLTADDDHWFADSAHIQGDVLSDALYAAARNGHTPVVEYLLDRGANIDAKGVFGATGLHWAAMHGHRDTVQTLVGRGANLALEDHRFKATPAGWASEGGHSNLSTLLSRQPPSGS